MLKKIANFGVLIYCCSLIGHLGYFSYLKISSMNLQSKISNINLQIEEEISKLDAVESFLPANERLRQDVEIQKYSIKAGLLEEKFQTTECKSKKHLLQAFTFLDFSKNCNQLID